jgi:hypothetical protein
MENNMAQLRALRHGGEAWDMLDFLCPCGDATAAQGELLINIDRFSHYTCRFLLTSRVGFGRLSRSNRSVDIIQNRKPVQMQAGGRAVR